MDYLGIFVMRSFLVYNYYKVYLCIVLPIKYFYLLCPLLTRWLSLTPYGWMDGWKKGLHDTNRTITEFKLYGTIDNFSLVLLAIQNYLQAILDC